MINFEEHRKVRNKFIINETVSSFTIESCSGKIFLAIIVVSKCLSVIIFVVFFILPVKVWLRKFIEYWSLAK